MIGCEFLKGALKCFFEGVEFLGGFQGSWNGAEVLDFYGFLKCFFNSREGGLVAINGEMTKPFFGEPLFD